MERRLTLVWGVALAIASAQPVRAHDLERTRVALAFAADGTFVLDVTNDAGWLLQRLEPFASQRALEQRLAERDRRLTELEPVFLDRVVLFVDGHEVRPTSVEYVRPALDEDPPLGTYRLRGRVPAGAKMLRWYYGLVIDPYPLTIRRADGRSMPHEVEAGAWSAPVDLTGAFRAPMRLSIAQERLALGVMVTLVVLALFISSRRTS